MSVWHACLLASAHASGARTHACMRLGLGVAESYDQYHVLHHTKVGLVQQPGVAALGLAQPGLVQQPTLADTTEKADEAPILTVAHVGGDAKTDNDDETDSSSDSESEI